VEALGKDRLLVRGTVRQSRNPRADPPQRPQSSQRGAEVLFSVVSVRSLLLLASFSSARKEMQILRCAQDDMSF
jgi:hypothetical protein